MGFVPNTSVNDTFSCIHNLKKDGDWVYVSGRFTQLGGVTGLNGLARYSITTGEVDSSWKPATGPIVFKLEFNSDKSKIFIIQSPNTSTSQRELRTVNVATAVVSSIILNGLGFSTIKVDSTHVYLSGTFTAVTVAGVNTSRTHICRINISDNTLDSWNPSFNGGISDMSIDADYVYAVGSFGTVNAVSHNRVVKLNKSNAAVASDWNAVSNTGQTVSSLTIGSDNNLYVWGPSYWNLTNLGTSGFLVKCSKTGVRDAAFSSGTLASGVTATSAQAAPKIWEVDGSLYITWGATNTASGKIRKGIFKVNMTTRAVDESFDTFTSGAVVENSQYTKFGFSSLISDGVNLHVGADRLFSYKNTRLLIHAINPATAAVALTPATNRYDTPEVVSGTIYKQIQLGEYTYAFGMFTIFDGVTGYKHAARYNTLTGVTDESWKPQVSMAAVRTAVLHPDGLSFYVGGGTSGTPVANFKRIRISDGVEITVPTMKASYVPKMVLDGTTLWIAGGFSELSNVPVDAGGSGFVVSTSAKVPLAKLDTTTGLLDIDYSSRLSQNFSLGNVANPYDIAVDSGGVFIAMNTTVTYEGLSNMARLFKVKKSISEGELPTAANWQGGTGSTGQVINCIHVGSNGSVYIGGYLSSGWNGVGLSGTQGRVVLKLDSNGVRDTGWATANFGIGQCVSILELNNSLYAVGPDDGAIRKSTSLSSFVFDTNFIPPINEGNIQRTMSMAAINGKLLVSLDTAGAGSGSLSGVLSTTVAIDPATGGISKLSARDSVSPTVILSSEVSVGATTATNPVAMTVTFSENIAGFISSDLSLTNCTVSGFTGSGSSYSFNVVPTEPGPVSVSIPADSAVDAVGNGNLVSNTYSFTFTSGIPVVGSAATVARNQLLDMTLSRTALIDVSAVPLVQWKRVLAVYTSPGKKKVVVSFKFAAGAAAPGRFLARIAGPASYLLSKMIIIKIGGQGVVIQRADFPTVSGVDVDVT